MKYAVREEKMIHKDRHNVSEVKYWGIFDTEEEAEEFADTISGRKVDVCSINLPEKEKLRD